MFLLLDMEQYVEVYNIQNNFQSHYCIGQINDHNLKRMFQNINDY
jgi:hypothetical protein